MNLDFKLNQIIKELDAIKASITDILTLQAGQNSILQKILAAVTPLPTAKVRFVFYKDGQPLPIGDKMQLKDTQSVTFTFDAEDSKGFKTSLDPTKTTVSTDNTAVATVAMNPDGSGGTLTAVAPGTCQLTGQAVDASNPNDSIPIDPVSVEVIAGDTATVKVTFGTPTP